MEKLRCNGIAVDTLSNIQGKAKEVDTLARILLDRICKECAKYKNIKSGKGFEMNETFYVCSILLNCAETANKQLNAVIEECEII